MPFGQSYFLGKLAEGLVETVTGSKEAGKAAHILVSAKVAAVTLDPLGHATSWVDVTATTAELVADSATDTAMDVVTDTAVDTSFDYSPSYSSESSYSSSYSSEPHFGDSESGNNLATSDVQMLSSEDAKMALDNFKEPVGTENVEALKEAYVEAKDKENFDIFMDKLGKTKGINSDISENIVKAVTNLTFGGYN